MFSWLTLLLALAITIALFATVLHHLFLKTPYIRTSHSVARAMVECAQLRAGDHVYDLGAGDGSILREAIRACAGIHATGIEAVPLVWLLGWIACSSTEIRFLLADARKVHWQDADVIFVYLMPSMLVSLVPQFRKLKSGSRIISRAFRIPEMEPTESRVIDSVTFHCYHV